MLFVIQNTKSCKYVKYIFEIQYLYFKYLPALLLMMFMDVSVGW